MLSRVAYHLYWMARYLERTDHLARYVNVEYFSSLDSPDPRQHTLALKSIIDMAGMPEVEEDELNEEEILVSAALDEKNPVSILSSLYSCRENARSVRESISTELWESINQFYHFVVSYPVDVYKTRGLSDFTNNVMQHCSNVRGRIMHTLLRNVGWRCVQLGLYIERSAQIARIMSSKLNDIEEINKFVLGPSMEAQQWNILLDCVEAKDMCRKFYSAGPDKQTTLEFLLFNTYFPKSLINNLLNLKKTLISIGKKPEGDNKSIEFRVGKLKAPFEYVEVYEIIDNPEKFLEDTLNKIYLISDLIVEEYFN